jgi:hypothetical protein
MRKTVGALAAVVSLLWALPVASLATGNLPHQYGVELQLGGGYLSLADVNDFVPATTFSGITPENKINVGAQFGVGILYRQLTDFGWQIGYNRFVSVADSKFRITDYPRSPESWAEQTLSGSELYAMATWYLPYTGDRWWLRWMKEVSFGVGPALYSANMDRSIDIAQPDGGSHLTAGSFADASGRSFGFTAALGAEIRLKENTGLAISLGGRLAKVNKLTYKDTSDQEITVLLNSASNATMPVDFSGLFLKISLRGYFQPTSDWRNPQR